MVYETQRRVMPNSAAEEGPAAYLQRSRLLGRFVRAKDRGIHLFFVEAGPGQGKSTLVAQHTHGLSHPTCWLSLENRHTDPAILLQALKALGLTPDTANANPTTLVVDNLERLAQAKRSLSILQSLLISPPPKRTTILISREPIAPLFKGKIPPQAMIHIGHHELSLTVTEVARCLATLFEITPPRETVHQIHRLTQGWFPGVLSCARALLAPESHDMDTIIPLEIERFFHDEILKKEIGTHHLPLLGTLAWCGTIPMELAEHVSQSREVKALFHELARRHLFVSFKDETKQEAILHPQLKQTLRRLNIAPLGHRERAPMAQRMAAWYEGKGAPEEAARLCLLAGDYGRVEALVEENRLFLWDDKRLARLSPVMERIPMETFETCPWLALSCGTALCEKDPAKALAFLKVAAARFELMGHHPGLLITQAKFIHFHTWMDGRFERGRRFLEPVKQSLEELQESLPPHLLIEALCALAGGETFFNSNLSDASRYADRALHMAMQNGFESAACQIRITRCYIHGVTGDWRRFNLELPPLLPLLTAPGVSPYTRGVGWFSLINILILEGQLENYTHYRDITPLFIGNEALLKGLGKPFIHIWDMDASLSKGELDMAENVINQALCPPAPHLSAHMKSQLLHYQAFVLAMQNQPHQIPDICQQALMERETAGMPLFEGLTRMITGGALVISGHLEMAHILLKEARIRFEKLNDTFGLVATFAHLAHLYWITGHHDEARSATASWLRIMRIKRYRHHFTWTPQICGFLLDRAVAEKIEVKTAKHLAALRLDRAYTPKGEPIPLLKIETFGGFRLLVNGRPTLSIEELTPSQQRLFAMLITRQNHHLSIDEIQSRFWPEASPQKGRANLDTLVSRLKKSIKKAISDVDPSVYLAIRKEKVVLSNASVDLWTFLHDAHDGLKEHRAGMHWQAVNRFRSAFTLAKGPCLSDLSDHGPCHEFREYTLGPMALKAAHAWALSSLELGLPPAGDIDLMERQITGAPESLELVRAIHAMHLQHTTPARADNLLTLYQNRLMDEGMPPSEVDLFLENFWNP